MKTIKQIAEELGVSKQAIFYRISKPPLSNALQGLVSKENGILTVKFDGEMLIKQAFGVDVAVKESSKENTSFDGEIIKRLFETVDSLIAQNADLTATIKIQAESMSHKPRKKRYNFNEKPPIETKTSIPIKRLMVRGK
jgi:hypothetical protein